MVQIASTPVRFKQLEMLELKMKDSIPRKSAFEQGDWYLMKDDYLGITEIRSRNDQMEYKKNRQVNNDFLY